MVNGVVVVEVVMILAVMDFNPRCGFYLYATFCTIGGGWITRKLGVGKVILQYPSAITTHYDSLHYVMRDTCKATSNYFTVK